MSFESENFLHKGLFDNNVSSIYMELKCELFNKTVQIKFHIPFVMLFETFLSITRFEKSDFGQIFSLKHLSL